MNKFLETLKIKIINRNFLNRRNNITLIKENNYDAISIDFCPSLLKASNDVDREKLSKKINNFFTVMQLRCKNFDYTIFLNNLKKRCLT